MQPLLRSADKMCLGHTDSNYAAYTLDKIYSSETKMITNSYKTFGPSLCIQYKCVYSNSAKKKEERTLLGVRRKEADCCCLLSDPGRIFVLRFFFNIIKNLHQFT